MLQIGIPPSNHQYFLLIRMSLLMIHFILSLSRSNIQLELVLIIFIQISISLGMYRQPRPFQPPMNQEPIPFTPRSFDQILSKIIKPIAQSKLEKLFPIQTKPDLGKSMSMFSSKHEYDAELDLQNPRDLRGAKNHPAISMSSAITSSSRGQFGNQMQQPALSYPHLPEGDSISSLLYQIDDFFDQLEGDICRYKIPSLKKNQFDPIKAKLKIKYSEQSQTLSQKIRNQVFKLKNQKPESNTDILNLFTTDVWAEYEKLNSTKQQMFQKCQEIFKAVIEKNSKSIESRQQKIEEIQQKYFDFTKTALLKVVLTEGLPKYQSSLYKKPHQPLKPVQKLDSSKICDQSSPYNIAFNEKTFSGLQPTGWLHNSVIDNYIDYLKQTQNYNKANSEIAIFTFNQSDAILSAENKYRFSNGPIFTRCDRVGMVINFNNDHWFFIAFYKKDSKLVIYDSIPKKSDKYNPYLEKLQRFIRLEQSTFNIRQKAVVSMISDDTTPKQTNGYDCGVHVLCNLSNFLQGQYDIEYKIQFDITFNNTIRVGMYHFMGYLFQLGRLEKRTIKYDWLEYASRSVLIDEKRAKLWV